MSHCTFHADKHGRWQCTQCNIHYCPTCIVSGHMLEWEHPCPICKKALTVSHEKQQTASISSYLPQALLYPLAFFKMPITYMWMGLVILLTMMDGLIQAITNIISHLERPIPPFFFVVIEKALELVIYLFIFYVGYLCLRTSARGYRHISNIFELYSERSTKGFIHFVLIFAFFSLISNAIYFAQSLNNIFPNISIPHVDKIPLSFSLFISAIANFFLIPTLMIAMFSRRLFIALNPLRQISLLWKLGPEYLHAYLAIALLSIASQLIFIFINQYILWVTTFFQCLFSLYFTLFSTHLAGYMLYHRHKALGFKIQIDACNNGSNWKNTHINTSLLLSQVKIISRKKDIRHAFQLLETYAQKSKSSKIHLKRLDLILKHEDPIFTQDHVMLSLDILIQHDTYHRQLCAIVERILTQIPQYAADPQHLYALIQVSFHVKQTILFQQLCTNFNQAYPRHENLIDLILLQLKTNAYPKSPHFALKQCTHLLKSFPQHPKKQDLEHWQHRLENKKTDPVKN